jgi:hypothetical protein
MRPAPVGPFTFRMWGEIEVSRGRGEPRGSGVSPGGAVEIQTEPRPDSFSLEKLE